MADERKSVLITGASGRGIGNHLARAFHERGFRVFATARKAESIDELKAKGIETLSLVVDDDESIQACYKQVRKLLGGKGLDYLVNNAGRNYTVPATDVDMDEAHSTFNTNFFGVIQMTQTFLPLLLKSKGMIVQIGSLAGIMPFVFGAVYNASKAALHSYSDCLRVELAPFGIHVLTIVTGGVISNIARTERHLPANSVFKAIEPAYQRRLVASQDNGIDTRTYADQVVHETLHARGWLWNKNEAWLGGGVRLVWWADLLDMWVPGGIYLRGMSRRFGLPRMMDAPKRRLEE